MFTQIAKKLMNKQDRHGIIDRLELYMQKRKITRSGLGRILDLQRSTIGNYLSGSTLPTLDKLEMLLKSDPDLNPNWLILGIGQMFYSEEERKTLIDFSELEKRMKILENRIERLENKMHIELG